MNSIQKGLTSSSTTVNHFRAWLLALLLLFCTATSSLARDIDVLVVLGDGPRYVLSEHGVPNGVSCDWYAYATVVGLPYCSHPGVDLDVAYEPLYAATDGVVEFAGADGYYTPYHVDIRVVGDLFAGELHIYGHMSEIWVEQGQTVKRGDQIGITGAANGWPHLHFERRTAVSNAYPVGRAIDPEPVLEWDGKVVSNVETPTS